MSLAPAAKSGAPEGEAAPLRLRLYIAGTAPNSVAALDNLRALCRDGLGSDCAVEVVDVLEEPMRALDDGIIVTPTLVRLEPDPPVFVVGDLGDRDSVLRVLVAGAGWGA